MSRQPEVLWAQRSSKVYLTIGLPDAKDVEIKCDPEGVFIFSATGPRQDSFHVHLHLFGNLNPEGSRTKIGLRNIVCSIKKEKKVWWKRLLKSEEKPPPYIKVDWNKWCDDEEEEPQSGSDDDDDEDDDDDGVNRYEDLEDDDEGSDDDGLLYLPDLENVGSGRK